MKPLQLQRQTKERTKPFPGERPDGTCEFSESCDTRISIDTWPLEEIQHEALTVGDIESETSLTDQDILAWCVNILERSPSARLLIKEAVKFGWEVGLDDLGGNDFHLDIPEKLIVLDTGGLLPSALARSVYFRHMVLVSLVRALRDVWQERRHGGFDRDYGPEAILMLERVRAADCDVMGILVGWELRGEGYGDLWRYLIGCDEGDMALAFSNYLEKDPAALFNGKALSAAFRQWYENPDRINACDHETLEYLDELIRIYGHGRIFGRKKLTQIGVEVLSCLPDKTAYLHGMGYNILMDPFFAGLEDPINQSHLMHIVRDLEITYVQNVPFRDASLADKIFPGGAFTCERETFSEIS